MVAVLSPKASVSLPAFSPPGPLSVSRGRPKHERWRDDSPIALSPEAPYPAKVLEPSFRDVLLAPSVPSLVAAPAVVGTVVTALADTPAPQGLTTCAPSLLAAPATAGTMVTAPADLPARHSWRAAPRSAPPRGHSPGHGWQRVELKKTR
jgi:hypothetical protein